MNREKKGGTQRERAHDAAHIQKTGAEEGERKVGGQQDRGTRQRDRERKGQEGAEGGSLYLDGHEVCRDSVAPPQLTRYAPGPKQKIELKLSVLLLEREKVFDICFLS